MIGWYQRGGGLGRYSVWHEVLALEACAAPTARFEVFERLGLTEPGAAPHSAVVALAPSTSTCTPADRDAVP